VSGRRHLIDQDVPNAVEPKVILYLRRPFGKRRGMDPENEAELLTVMRASLREDYTLHVFENGSNWVKDRQHFAQAAVVFGPHGGAFANIIFLPPAAHVIEFVGVGKHGMNDRPCYQGLALASGLGYSGVIPTAGFHFEDKRHQMAVDPAQVVQILHRIGVAID
jgi:hypothetical protein